MAEYTYSNIIIDPTKKGIESLIGKEVYFHNNPSLCLENANEKLTSNLGILVEISKNSIVPFRIEQKCGTCAHTCAHACIIIKKEEPKKYVPFENAREFINVYSCVEATSLKKEDYFLSSHGIWLKRKDKPPILMVTEIYSFGVVISGDMNTTKKPNDEYVTITETTLWGELLMLYTFLDGSPCGKEVEDE